jgi:hypothetical protein
MSTAISSPQVEHVSCTFSKIRETQLMVRKLHRTLSYILLPEGEGISLAKCCYKECSADKILPRRISSTQAFLFDEQTGQPKKLEFS